MISENCLLGRKLIAYATPMVQFSITSVAENNEVYRIQLENGIQFIYTEQQIESLLVGNRVNGYILLGIDE